MDEYIGCGWALFIPYIALYLSYAAVGGPVQAGFTCGQATLPCLLESFWVLHGLNAILGAGFIARRISFARPLRREFFARIAPWVLLFVFIAIPDLYLEFPGDPVAHLGRIFEWSRTIHLTEHSSWTKFSYFFAYSLAAIPGSPTDWLLLRCYYAGIVLLFCWQSYRLAHALRLEAPTALVFAILQLAIMGNGTFSFHRYYGISSTLLSQAGVLALQSTVITYLEAPRGVVGSTRRLSAALLAQIVLIGINHIQGLLLAAVGTCGIVLWKACSFRRSKLCLTMLGVGCAGSALMLVLSADWPSLVRLRDAGWLTSLGTFRFLAGTPATDRVLELLGPLGILGLLLGFGLFRHRSAAGWLMLAPWIVICLPLTSIPLAAFLATAGAGAKGDNIALFSRLFFAVPLALPFAWILSKAIRLPGPKVGTIALLGLLVGLTAPPEFGRYHYNRFWQAVAKTPDDLRFKSLEAVAPAIAAITRDGDEKKLLGATGLSFCLAQLGNGMVPFQRRIDAPRGSGSIAREQSEIQDYLRSMAGRREIVVLGVDRGAFFSAGSQAGLLSGHWSPFEAASALAGAPELHDAAKALQFHERRLEPNAWLMTNFPIVAPQP